MYIIDRTKNTSGKSIPNTQRFLARARAEIAENVAEIVRHGSIKEVADGTRNQILVTGRGLHEPHFWIDANNSDWNRVFPGNPQTEDSLTYFNTPSFKIDIRSQMLSYNEGDVIEKPSGSGSVSGGSSSGDGIDDFIFSLTKEQWDQFLFDHMYLPNQDESKHAMTLPAWRKAGYTLTGSPANLSMIRTMRNSFGRRIALGRPKTEEVEALEQEIKDTPDGDLKDFLMESLSVLKRKMEFVPWIDPIDVRYQTRVKEMQPKFNAVMFCLMDCSASMTENMKDLAKRFYVLLYRFLQSKYEKVEVVFIRHTHEAKEVDEETFFYSPETGGTVVSTAFEEMIKVVADRYPTEHWNIYCAQASDGDNSRSDNELTKMLLEKKIFPMTQYFMYIEVAREYNNDFYNTKHDSDLWGLYKKFLPTYEKTFIMKKIKDKKDVLPTLIKIFGEK